MRYHTSMNLQMDFTVEPFVMLIVVGLFSNNMIVVL